MEEDDFEFVPPDEILSVNRDTWYDRYANHPDVALYHVTYRGVGGLLYSMRTWARDEMDAYNRVMRNEVIAAPPEEGL